MKKISGLERGVLVITLVFCLVTVAWFVAENRSQPLMRVETTGGEQVAPPTAADPAPGILDGELIDINHAAEGDLIRLPGIGQVRAAEIIRYREENGGFQVKEDIMNVSGIGEAVFGQIEAHITVEGGSGYAEDIGGG